MQPYMKPPWHKAQAASDRDGGEKISGKGDPFALRQTKTSQAPPPEVWMRAPDITRCQRHAGTFSMIVFPGPGVLMWSGTQNLPSETTAPAAERVIPPYWERFRRAALLLPRILRAISHHPASPPSPPHPPHHTLLPGPIPPEKHARTYKTRLPIPALCSLPPRSWPPCQYRVCCRG